MNVCTYCADKANPSGMCDACDKRMNGNTHADRAKVEDIRRIDAGFTQNAGNGSAQARELHDLAYWGIVPKRYL